MKNLINDNFVNKNISRGNTTNFFKIRNVRVKSPVPGIDKLQINKRKTNFHMPKLRFQKPKPK